MSAILKQTSNKKHIRQVGLKIFEDDEKILNEIFKDEPDFKYDSDAIRLALKLYSINKKTFDIILDHKNEIKRINDKNEGLEWRLNALADEVAMVRSENKVLSSEIRESNRLAVESNNLVKKLITNLTQGN